MFSKEQGTHDIQEQKKNEKNRIHTPCVQDTRRCNLKKKKKDWTNNIKHLTPFSIATTLHTHSLSHAHTKTWKQGTSTFEKKKRRRRSCMSCLQRRLHGSNDPLQGGLCVNLTFKAALMYTHHSRLHAREEQREESNNSGLGYQRQPIQGRRNNKRILF